MLTNKQISYLPYDDYAQSANTLFHFMTKPEYLESILRRKAIIPRYCVETIDYLNIYTPVENGKVSLSDVKRYFHCYESFLRRLNAIESKLSISIPPILLNDLPREEQQDIDELYLLLCEKKVVRLNAKLTSTDSMSVDMKYTETPLTIGSKIVLTFLSDIKFNFLKQAITLHTANLLINALVKDIQKSDDGTVQILYGDTDSKPMYISFSAFETVEEAKHEENTILQHDEIYVNALTSNAYINQYYEE